MTTADPTPSPLLPQNLWSTLGYDSPKSVQLHTALSDGDIQRFRQILEEGFERRDLGWSMHTALEHNLPEFVSEIVGRGYPVTGGLARVALTYGSKETLRALRNAGWDINEPLGQDQPPLLAYAANEDMAVWLLDEGADPNREDSFGVNPMAAAVQYASIRIVKLLLDRGADVRRGKLLHHALNRKENIIEMIDLLVGRGAPLDSFMYEPGTYAWGFYFWMGTGTPLQKAVEIGRADLVQHLLRKGADASIANPKGETPLDVARRLGHLEIVALLDS